MDNSIQQFSDQTRSNKSAVIALTKSTALEFAAMFLVHPRYRQSPRCCLMLLLKS
jgi:hypothetical protein